MSFSGPVRVAAFFRQLAISREKIGDILEKIEGDFLVKFQHAEKIAIYRTSAINQPMLVTLANDHPTQWSDPVGEGDANIWKINWDLETW